MYDYIRVEEKEGKDKIENFYKNPISKKEQAQIIEDIYKHVLKCSKGQAYILNPNNKKGVSVITLDSTKASLEEFTFIANKIAKGKLILKGEKFKGATCINIKLIMNAIKSNEKLFSLERSSSILGDGNFEINEENKTISIVDPKKVNLIKEEELTDEEKKEIIDGYNKHWLNKIEPITEWLLISKYVTDLKKFNLAILAGSNYGKGFHFKMFEDMGVSSMVKVEDYSQNGKGINNAPVEDYAGKHFLTFDEVGYFPRNMFDIVDYINYRPMGKHTFKIKTHARVFLNADGGIFNNRSLDKQILNRIKIIDFRKENREINDLDIVKKYSLDTVYNVVFEYYIDFVKHYDSKFKNMTHKEILARVKELNDILGDEKNAPKYTSFDESVNEAFKTLIEQPELLEDKELDNLEHCVRVNSKRDKAVIINPKNYLFALLKAIDGELEDELKYKKIKNLVNAIDSIKESGLRINGKYIKGLVVDLTKFDTSSLFKILRHQLRNS
jgi:hypothetical protein